MATPASGAISMLDMRSEITRGTGAISISEVRTRAGRTGAISFGDMYAAEGWTQTNGVYVSKFYSLYGWDYTFSVGSISPAESGNRLSITTSPSPGCSITGFFRNPVTANSSARFANGTYLTATNAADIAAGYRPTDIIRFVAANTSYAVSATTNSTCQVAYSVANTGTIHCMIQF
jgi:hypothetical protein